MKVVKPFAITCTSGACEVRSVKMFDITDPWKANGAEQPLGGDQLRQLYKKAVVVGVKIIVRMHNKGSAGVMFGVTPMPESQADNGLTSLQHYMELPATKARLLSPEMDHAIIAHKVGTARHVGVKKLRDEDAFHCDFAGEVGPTRDAYIHTWVQPVDQTTTNAVECVITVEFLVSLWDMVVPARSTDT